MIKSRFNCINIKLYFIGMDIDSFFYLAMKQCQGLGYTKGKIAVLALHTNHAIAVRGLIKRPSLSSVLKAPSQTKCNIL